MKLSNQLQQQISAKMNTVFTADGLEELEESMAQCNSFKSMKCSCTDYLCCLPGPPMPEPKVDTTNHDINFIPFSFYCVADVMNGEISNTLGYVLQHLVVNIQAINTVNCRHPEWHPSYVIECMCDDLLR